MQWRDGFWNAHVVEDSILQDEAVLIPGAVEVPPGDVAGIVNSAGGGCARTGIVNLGEMSVAEHVPVLVSARVVEASHNVTPRALMARAAVNDALGKSMVEKTPLRSRKP
jgi:hypothetical protein